MNRIGWVIVPLRILLALLFAGLLVAQFLSLPGMFAYRAEQNPDLGALPWVLLAVAILGVVCLQVVIVCIWRLLGLVRSDRIFSPQSFVWVDAIVWAMVAGWLLLAGISAYIVGVIYFTPELRDPGTPALLFGIVLTGGVVVLTVAVLRILLRRATVLQSDLAEVI